MFQQGGASALRYHKALLLLEGLTLLLTEGQDLISLSRCEPPAAPRPAISPPELTLSFWNFLSAGKECIERRLTALHSGLCV